MLSNGIHISDETLRVIGEFSINWSVFEATYCNNEASVGKIRRLDIQPANDKQEFHEAIDKFRNDLRTFFSERNWNIDEEKIKYCLYSEVSQQRTSRIQEDIEIIKTFLLGDSDDYRAALLCVQRIRNNFFHGTKEFYHLDKQQNLFESASNLLYCLSKNL